MHYLYVNESAGQARDGKFWSERLSGQGVETTPCPQAAPEGLPSMGEDDVLVAAGGDGTLSRLAPWCIRQGCALAVLPAGTGNDFARGLGIPLDPDEACRTVAEGVPGAVDVGRVNGDVFLNLAHVGLGSEISRDLDESDKQWWGRFSYVRKLVERLQQRRGFKATINCDGLIRRGRWLEIAIANGSSFGGGHRLFEASPFDGQLDLVAVRPQPVWRLLSVWLRAQLRRSTPPDSALLKLRGARCEIRDCGRRSFTADGEPAGQAPALFESAPRALKVILPRGRKDA